MNNSSLLKKAISAIKAGDKLSARKMLNEILENDPTYEDAWLWLTKTTKNRARQREYLEKVLDINPDHKTAHKALEILIKKSPTREPKSKPGNENAPNRKRNNLALIIGGIVLGCIIIGVSAGLVIELTRNNTPSTNMPAALSSHTSSPESSPVPTQPPSPTPKSEIADIIYEFEGRGDDFIQIRVPDTGRGFWRAYHSGDSNFIVDHVSQNNFSSLWVNEIGGYEGRGTEIFSYSGLHTIEIKADGYWILAIQVPNHSVDQRDLESYYGSALKYEDGNVIISDLLPTSTVTPVPSSTPIPTSTPTPLPSGSVVNTDDGWSLRVADIYYSERLEDGDFVYIAEGRYIHLLLEVTNNNRRNATFVPVGNLELVTGSGLSYKPDEFADIINDDVYGVEWQNKPVDLKPGESGFEVVSFDIPLDSHGPYILQGGMLSDLDAKVLVEIE